MDNQHDAWRKLVESDFNGDPKDLLFEIYKEAMTEHTGSEEHIKKHDHRRLPRTIAKASTLIARLSSDQEKIAVRMETHTIAIRKLTVGLYWFTATLIVISLFQIALSFCK